MIETSIDNYISLILMLILIVQYLSIIIVGLKMIRSGYNGIIRAIVTNRIALSVLLLIVVINSTIIILPDELLMLSLFSLVGSNIYMHAALSTESKRPIKSTGKTMRRIYSDLEKPVTKEVSNDDSN